MHIATYTFKKEKPRRQITKPRLCRFREFSLWSDLIFSKKNTAALNAKGKAQKIAEIK